MAIAHLSYVICDVCGAPASQPEDDAKAAREMVPADWRRERVDDGFRLVARDICPAHKPGEQEQER